jgi:hypothetical protein
MLPVIRVGKYATNIGFLLGRGLSIKDDRAKEGGKRFTPRK